MGFTAESPVVAGTILIRSAIQSPNFVTTVSGWAIMQDGSAEFNNVIVRGELDVNGSGNSFLHIFNFGGATPVIQMYPGDFSPTSFNLSTYGLISTQKSTSPHAGQLILAAPGYGNSTLIIVQGDSFENGAADSYVNFSTTAVQKNGTDLGGGTLFTASRSSTSGPVGAGAEAIAWTLSSMTFPANRAYQIRLNAGIAAATAGAEVQTRIRKAILAGQLLADFNRLACPTAAANYNMFGMHTFVTGGTAVTAALVVTLQSTTGTATILGSLTGSRSEIRVVDVGTAAVQLAQDTNTPILV